MLGGIAMDNGPHCRALYPKLQCHYYTTGWCAGSEKAYLLEAFCADHVNVEQVSIHSFCESVQGWQSGGERKVVVCVRHPYLTD